MYKIYLNGQLLHDLSNPGRVVADPVLNLERGVAGTLDCKVPVVNGAYGAIKKMVSVIEVYQDDKRLWCGRVLNQTLDWDNSKVLTVEGVLNFLNDSVMPPHTNLDEVSGLNMDLAQYLGYLITEHNNQVEGFKAFELGRVTVDYEKFNAQTQDDEIPEREEKGYKKTRDIINDLVGQYGGFLVAKPKTANATYPIILELLKDYDQVNTQTIEFGKNLLTMERAISGADIFSAVIPTGKTDGAGVPLTIEDATQSGGSVMIEDPELVRIFGKIISTVEHSEIDDEDELYEAGRKDLTEVKSKMYKVTLTAVDLSLLDKSIDSFSVGDKIRVVSTAHNFDMELPVTNLRLDLANPERSELTVGDSVNRIVDTVSSSAKKLADQYNKLSNLKNTYTWVVYADTPQGGNISLVQLPSSKYRGVAWNKPVKDVDTSNPGIFAWSPLTSVVELKTHYTKTGDIATFIAEVFIDGVNVTGNYDNALFKWFKKNENGEVLLGTGKTIAVSASDMGYGGTIVCEFAHVREYGLLDRQSNLYVSRNGEKYIGRS